jgi:hypothetical protein
MHRAKNKILALLIGIFIPIIAYCGLETGVYISDLVATNPTSSDLASTADDHLRLIKSTVKTTFPNVSGAVTPTHTELNYVDGVTSAIQTQIDAKLASSSYTASDVLSKLLTVDGSGSSIDSDLLDGVSSGGFCQTGGSGCPNAATIGGWTSSNDGSGSGLDADLLDGLSSASFAQPTTGSFTATYTGFSSNPTGTAYYAKIDNKVCVSYSDASGTSNAMSFTITGLPSALQIASRPGTHRATATTTGTSGGTPNLVSFAALPESSDTVTLYLFNSGGGQWNPTQWSNSSTKAIEGFTLCYNINN